MWSCPGSTKSFPTSKLGWLGVYHCLGPKHLQSYLDEFVRRFNRSRARHAAFRSFLAIATRVKPATYKMLILPEAVRGDRLKVFMRLWLRG